MARAVALIGRDAETIGGEVMVYDIPVKRCAQTWRRQWHGSLRQCLRKGDCVLLSPAASLDMYRNYAHRAEAFIESSERLGSHDDWRARFSSPGNCRDR